MILQSDRHVYSSGSDYYINITIIRIPDNWHYKQWYQLIRIILKGLRLVRAAPTEGWSYKYYLTYGKNVHCSKMALSALLRKIRVLI